MINWETKDIMPEGRNLERIKDFIGKVAKETIHFYLF